MTLVCPLLTRAAAAELAAAFAAGASTLDCSLDLGRTRERVALHTGAAETDRRWESRGVRYPLPESVRERTVYAWNGSAFEPVARYGGALIKLVPTDWGPP